MTRPGNNCAPGPGKPQRWVLSISVSRSIISTRTAKMTVPLAVAEVTLAGRQAYKPVNIRHWDGEPLEMLDRLDKW